MNLDRVRVLITSGPTRERIDPVRYITNRSSGKTGRALALRAFQMGGEVTLITSLEADLPPGIRVLPVESAQDMFKAVKKNFPGCDIFISSAAVADFRPSDPSDSKIRKQGGVPVIKLERTPDILEWAGKRRQDRVIAGFSLTDLPDTEAAREKMRRKNCQVMVANTVSNLGSGRKSFILISGEKEYARQGLTPEEAADIILEECATHLTNS